MKTNCSKVNTDRQFSRGEIQVDSETDFSTSNVFPTFFFFFSDQELTSGAMLGDRKIFWRSTVRQATSLNRDILATTRLYSMGTNSAWTILVSSHCHFRGGGRDQRRYISNTRMSVSSDFQSPRRGLKKRGKASCFLTTLEVFGKHSLECSQVPLKAQIILGEIQSKRSPNFMIIDQFLYI